MATLSYVSDQVAAEQQGLGVLLKQVRDGDTHIAQLTASLALKTEACAEALAAVAAKDAEITDHTSYALSAAQVAADELTALKTEHATAMAVAVAALAQVTAHRDKLATEIATAGNYIAKGDVQGVIAMWQHGQKTAAQLELEAIEREQAELDAKRLAVEKILEQ